MEMTAREYVLKVSWLWRVFVYDRWFNTLDFNFIYDWYENGIPLKVVTAAFPKDARNWTRGKFAFYWLDKKVKKICQTEKELKIGLPPIETEPLEEIEPPADTFPNLTPVEERALLEKYAENELLNIKTQMFLRNHGSLDLMPDVIRRYRLNFILRRGWK